MSHGILSGHLLLPDEDSGQWLELLERLMTELQPVGTMEQILVERIAVAVWRQRRLVRVETARIRVAQRPGVSEHWHIEQWVDPDDKKLIEEVLAGHGFEDRAERLAELLSAREAGVTNLDVLRVEYTRVWRLLLASAASSDSVTAFLAKHFKGAIEGFLAQAIHTHANLLKAHQIATEDRAANSLPAAPELMTRYQSALDNDLYKAMRALREAQRFRRETLDVQASNIDPAT